MLTVNHVTVPMDGEVCACCGHPIRRVIDPESLLLFLESTTLRRRSFQCMNCGRMVCHQCGADASCINCKSNAWTAIPCLDKQSEAMQWPTGN